MIYICIPAYDEEQTVGVVLWKIRQVMTEFRRDYQIIVADDASTDSTPSVLAPYARVLPLTILRNPERRGYAASLEMLLREAVARSPYPRRDVVVTLQADFTDDPADLVPLVKMTEAGADIVTGNVLLPDGTARSRRWARAAATWVARRMKWPEGAGDPLSNYRAYRVSTLARALEDRKDTRLLSCDGWAANVQLLHAATPHARRLESMELTERHERLQRETRFDAWSSLRQVLALARGRPPQAAPAASIAPSESRVSRDGIHVDAESVAEVAAARRAQSATAERERAAGRAAARGNGRGGERRDRAAGRGERAARSERGPARDRTAAAGERSPRAERPRRERAAGDPARPERERRPRPEPGERRERRPRRTAESAPAAAACDAASDAAEATEQQDPQQLTAAGEAGTQESAQDTAPRRRRRSRRGGRRRRGNGDAAAAADAADDPTAAGDERGGAPEAGAGETDAAAADAGETGSDGSDGTDRPKRRRSRRGSRGGRRRRSGAERGEVESGNGGDVSGHASGEQDGAGGGSTGRTEQDSGSPAYQVEEAEARRHAS